MPYNIILFFFWLDILCVCCCFFFLLLFICAYKAWFISPPCPHPLPYHPLHVKNISTYGYTGMGWTWLSGLWISDFCTGQSTQWMAMGLSPMKTSECSLCLAVLLFELRALCLLGENATTWARSAAKCQSLNTHSDFAPLRKVSLN
jgi:hypothetical protein